MDNKVTTWWQKAVLIATGIFLAVLLLELCLQLAGAFFLARQEHTNRIGLQDKHAFRILCIGESTTQKQYPPYLEKILNAQNLGIHFVVIDKGVGGTNTSMVLSQLEENLRIYQPRMVLAMIGINDWAVHMPPEEAPTSSPATIFIRSLKCYKLWRLLELHMRAKFEEWRHPRMPYDKSQELIQAGIRYKTQGKISLAQGEFSKAIQSDPYNPAAYFNLIWVTPDDAVQKRLLSQVSTLLENAVREHPDSDELLGKYWSLGMHLLEDSKYEEAIKIYSDIVRLRPNGDPAYVWLGKAYYRRGQYSLAKETYERALALNSTNRSAYENLSILCHDMGDYQRAEEYAAKANALDPHRLYPATVGNYRAIKRILDQWKIHLVCIQYPLRPINILRDVFPQGGVTFVDNEGVFKEALEQGSYRDYFRDSFAGDFGHCTDKGNRLVAKNIALVILKEILSTPNKGLE